MSIKSNITSYSKNPNLGFSTVKTINGIIEYRKNCKYLKENKSIKEGYYSIYTDIFYIESEEKWYRVSSEKIEKDWETNKWYLKDYNSKLQKGVVGIEEDGGLIFDKFTANPYNNVIINSNGNSYNALNKEILKDFFIEDIGHSSFVRKSEYGSSDIKNFSKIRNAKNYTSKGYNIEDNGAEFERKKNLYRDYFLKIGPDAKKYAKYLGDISFGSEIECSEGAIPDYIQNRHGIVVCRDGSLEGG